MKKLLRSLPSIVLILILGTLFIITFSTIPGLKFTSGVFSSGTKISALHSTEEALNGYPSYSMQATSPFSVVSTGYPIGTPTQTKTPKPTVKIGPPTIWPTEWLWPPVTLTPGLITPTSTVTPFPTPNIKKMDLKNGETVPRLFFILYKDAVSSPVIANARVEEKGLFYGIDSQVFNLNLSPISRYFNIQRLRASQDGKWVMLELAVGESTQFKLLEISSQKIISKNGQFASWTSDANKVISLHDLILSKSFKVFHQTTNESLIIDLPEKGGIPADVYEASYSPNDTLIADGVVYPPVAGLSQNYLFEIGIRQGERGERKSVCTIPGGSYTVHSSLKWSPDGTSLSWILFNHIDKSKMSEVQTQLWAYDFKNENCQMIAVIGVSKNYHYDQSWSPDSKNIAFIKTEQSTDLIVSNNIFLVETNTGALRQITHFKDEKITYVQFSPGGEEIAYTLSKGNYGEIHVMALDGSMDTAVVGPTMPDAPFAWIK